MPGSPVANIRRLQSAIRCGGGRDVPTLDLVRGLLAQLQGSGSLRFTRASLADYESKLRNWQVADRVIGEAIEAREALPPPRSIMEDPPPIHLKVAYACYVGQAKEAGLEPLAYATFKTRAADYPSRARKVLRRG